VSGVLEFRQIVKIMWRPDFPRGSRPFMTYEPFRMGGSATAAKGRGSRSDYFSRRAGL
jgi:hypothetical protein